MVRRKSAMGREFQFARLESSRSGRPNVMASREGKQFWKPAIGSERWRALG